MRINFLTKISLFLIYLLPFFSIAQNVGYKWTITSSKISAGEFELNFTTEGVKGWQLYAPNQIIEGVKMAELVFSDSSFQMLDNFEATGKITNVSSKIFEGLIVKIYENKTLWKVRINVKGEVPASLQGVLNFYYGNQESFNSGTPFHFSVPLEGGIIPKLKIKISSIDINNPINNCGDDATSDKSLLVVFLLGLFGGILALLTPCVFPMIPVTVTFFTKKSHNKSAAVSNAIFYGLFIFLIYIAITLPFHLANEAINPEIFNNISTNVWLNLLFFVIFVLFAFSFFGYFEIGLPAYFANKLDAKSGLGNIGGIFFMAATLAIVSFSCTGPILGTLLVGVANQGAWPLTIGAAGFGLALALPFALFALFPNWLHSLPKSGGWMTSIKVVLGFIELALAIKFFSNADLVQQWGLLKREVFIGLWIVIGVLIVIYLLGKLKFPHSEKVEKFSFSRIVFILFFSALTIYLIPGLTNTKWAELKLISGFPPPRSNYSIYKKEKIDKKIIEPFKNNYEAALEVAKRENKPLLIDFTGWACVNCRRMEEKVWSDAEVENLMRNKFVIVSLYVDDRVKLPITEQTIFNSAAGQIKSIVTEGDKWAAFQIENFGAASQPQYVIISSDEKLLVKPKFYTPNVNDFSKWLRCGLEVFEKNKK